MREQRRQTTHTVTVPAVSSQSHTGSPNIYRRKAANVWFDTNSTCSPHLKSKNHFKIRRAKMVDNAECMCNNRVMQHEEQKKRDFPRVLGSSGGGSLFISALLQAFKLIPSTVAGITVDPFITIFAGCFGLCVLLGLNWRTIRCILSDRYRFHTNYKTISDARSYFTNQHHKWQDIYQSRTTQRAQCSNVTRNYARTMRMLLTKYKIYLPEPHSSFDYEYWTNLMDEVAELSYKKDLKTARERFPSSRT